MYAIRSYYEKQGLDSRAYTILAEGEKYPPYVAPDEHPAEFTLKSIGLGILFGIIYGAANAYLGLRAGLTISTSIPVAVMTVAAFHALRSFGGRAHILEANLAQTVGSSSSVITSYSIHYTKLYDLTGRRIALNFGAAFRKNEGFAHEPENVVGGQKQKNVEG